MNATTCSYKRYKKYIGFLLIGMVFISIMFLLACLQTMAAEETQDIVRVGIYPLAGYNQVIDGNVSGYNYEYLHEIAEITGWKYEFVPLSDYEEGLKKLDRQEIDFLAPAQKTEEYLERYLYSDYSFGKGFTALIANADRTELDYEEYSEFEGMRVAMVRNSVYVPYFKEYAEKNDFTVQYVYCDSTTSMLTLLHQQVVDAAVVNLLEAKENDKVLARFGQVPFYYISYQGNEKLMEELNTAMEKIQNTKPNLLSELEEIYLSVYDIQYFTPEQREFIKNAGRITVGYPQDNRPIAYKNPETGEFEGMLRDIMDRLQDISGLQFEYVSLPEEDVGYESFQKNGIDIMTHVTYNQANRNMSKMAVTRPYDSMSLVMVGKKDMVFYQNSCLKLALSTVSPMLEKDIKATYPNYVQTNYDTKEEAFEAVLNGKEDVVLVNQYIADYWLGNPKYSSLAIIPVAAISDEHCLAVMNYAEQGETADYILLRNILDVAISKLPQDEVRMIIYQNMVTSKYQYTWKDFVYDNSLTLLLGVLLVVGCFVAQIVFANIRKKNYQTLAEKERKLAIQQKRYELIMEKSEDIIFEIDMQTGNMPVSDIMREKFGWALDDLKVSTDPDDIIKRWKVHKDDAFVLKQAYVATSMEGKDSECVVRLMKKDAGYVWCRVRRYPILNEKGDVVKVIGNIVNIDQMTKETQKLKTQTRTDPMTGLLNKNTFITEVTEYLQETDRKNYCMVFFDLDHFKQVNDCLGHLTGDHAIRESAQKLQTNFANVDFVSRFGGDEFCIFVKNIPVETMKDKLEYLREKLHTQYDNLGQTVTVTASIGAVYYHRPEKNVDMILEEADRAAYRAKCEGRNRVVFREIK